MPSKWLAAFREADESPLCIFEPCADSADSANSSAPQRSTTPIGTIGTIGTGGQSGTQPGRRDLSALPALSAQGNEIETAVSSLVPVAAIDPSDLDERAAIIEHDGGIPRIWSEGFAAMTAMAPPAGFSPDRWQRVTDATGTFLDKWAADAIRCGWTDLDVFGCHPERPAARFDAMGLVLLLVSAEVVSVDAEGADLVTKTGARQRFRRRPLPPGTVSLWQLVRK